MRDEPVVSHLAVASEAFVDSNNTPPLATPFGRDMADKASPCLCQIRQRPQRYHPAKLNFGDCMAYAVSAVMRAPLLFKERRFSVLRT